jgi:hypothetical protein
MTASGLSPSTTWERPLDLQFGSLVNGLAFVDVDQYETYPLGGEDPYEQVAVPAYWSPGLLISPLSAKSPALIFAPVVSRTYADDFDAIVETAQRDPARGHLVLPPLTRDRLLGPLHGDPLVVLLSRPSLVHLAFLVDSPAQHLAQMSEGARAVLRDALVAFWAT